MKKRHLLEVRYGKLNSLNPKEILKRGYTITKVGDKFIQSIEELEKGTNLEIIYQDGKVITKIEEIKK